MTAPQLPSDAACSLEGDAPALVPPGEYDLRFDYYDTATMFGCAPKLVLWFTIITRATFFGSMRGYFEPLRGSIAYR
jgi:hypothetical protein